MQRGTGAVRRVDAAEQVRRDLQPSEPVRMSGVFWKFN
jgi:hypothetical protein